MIEDCALSESRALEQSMPRGGKRICDRDTPPSESFLQVLGTKQATSAFRCGREDHRVPNVELMVGREVRRREHHLGGGLKQREGLSPTQRRFARTRPALRISRSQQLTQRLYG